MQAGLKLDWLACDCSVINIKSTQSVRQGGWCLSGLFKHRSITLYASHICKLQEIVLSHIFLPIISVGICLHIHQLVVYRGQQGLFSQHSASVFEVAPI